jgi:hypothetical protein
MVVRVEVKAGKTGTLRSLHVFLREKEREFGLRLWGSVPRRTAEPGVVAPEWRHKYYLVHELQSGLEQAEEDLHHLVRLQQSAGHSTRLRSALAIHEA